MRKRTGWQAATALLCGLNFAAAQVQVIELQAQAQVEGAEAKAQAGEAQAEAGVGRKIKILALPPAGESQYAIGVALDELPEVVKAQLRLERGLVVSNVLEKSPAEQAGVQRNDVLLSAGGIDVKTPADVVAAVAKAEMNPLALVLLRAGKELQVEVKPDAKTRFRVAVPGGGELDVLTRAFEKALPKGGPPAAYFIEGQDVIRVHPGVMLGRMKLDSLPEGVKLTVIKEGEQPAKIMVQKGEQKWEGTEDKLDSLPEELKGIVKKALSREGRFEMAIEAAQGDKIHAEVLKRKIQEADQKVQKAVNEAKEASSKHLKAPNPKEEVRKTEVKKGPPAGEGKLEAKLDEVLKRLDGADKLQKQVEELRDQLEALKKKQ